MSTHKHHHEKKTNKTPQWLQGAIVSVIVIGIIIIAGNYAISDQQMNKAPITPKPSPSESAEPSAGSSLSAEEKAKIDQWITDNDRNKYGDPKGSVYTGGTPLFDEATGEYTDLYDYILEKNPDRPWNK